MSPTSHFIPRNDYSKLIAAMLLIVLMAIIGYALQHTISCFLLSWIIAYLLEPVVGKMERRGLRRVTAIAWLYVILTLLSIFCLTFLIPRLTLSWNTFIHDLPLYIQKIKQIALDLGTWIPSKYGSEEFSWLIDNASKYIDSATQKAGKVAYTFGSQIFFNVFNLVLSPILVFFMLFYKNLIKSTIVSWLPENRRELLTKIANEVNNSIGGYLRGQIIVSIIVAIFSTITLLVMDIPHPIFCGIFAGAASVLPFIGVFIATLPALFFAWFKFQSIAAILQVIAAFGVIYFLEGYIIKPLIFKESMNLNPLITIIMVMALGEMLGFWGILLALPITAAIKITWDHFMDGDFQTTGRTSTGS